MCGQVCSQGAGRQRMEMHRHGRREQHANSSARDSPRTCTRRVGQEPQCEPPERTGSEEGVRTRISHHGLGGASVPIRTPPDGSWGATEQMPLPSHPCPPRARRDGYQLCFTATHGRQVWPLIWGVAGRAVPDTHSQADSASRFSSPAPVASLQVSAGIPSTARSSAG